MKTIKTLIGIALVGFLTSCGGNSNNNVDAAPAKKVEFGTYEKFTGGAQILFNEYEHDFGNVSNDNVLKHSFYFVNSGDAPLIISNAKGSCGCTIPSFETDPIPAGGQSQINVEVDPTNKLPGKSFQVTVRVESNAKDQLIKLTLKGVPNEDK